MKKYYIPKGTEITQVTNKGEKKDVVVKEDFVIDDGFYIEEIKEILKNNSEINNNNSHVLLKYTKQSILVKINNILEFEIGTIH